MTELEHLKDELQEFYEREATLLELIKKLDRVQKMHPVSFASPFRQDVDVKSVLKSMGLWDEYNLLD